MAAFQPASDAEAYSHIGAVGDVERPSVALKAAKDAPGDAAQLRHRGGIGMNADSHSRLLGHGRDLFDEVREALPDPIFGEFSDTF